MLKKDRGLWLWAIAGALPCLVIAHTFFPASDTFILFGNSYQLNYYSGWKTFIWQLSLLIVPFLASLASIVAHKKGRDHMSLLWIHSIVLFTMSWFIWWMIDNLRNVEEHSLLILACISGAVVAFAQFIRSYKRPSYREKNRELIKLIDQVEHEDLPAFLALLTSMDKRSANIDDPEYMNWWKEKLVMEVEIGKEGMQEALKKLAEEKERLK